jgi:hypothetical protein
MAIDTENLAISAFKALRNFTYLLLSMLLMYPHKDILREAANHGIEDEVFPRAF